MRLSDPNPNEQNPVPGLPDLPPEVAAVFGQASPAARKRLLALRETIYRTADGLDAVPAISESLKWGEPSYTPAKPGIGSSVRLCARNDGAVALMFICHTRIVEQFRELYSGTLTFEGNRAILLAPDAPIPQAEISHCIAMALTWKLANRSN